SDMFSLASYGQSYPLKGNVKNNQVDAAVIFRLPKAAGLFLAVIEPIFNRDFASTVIGGQRAKCVDTLQRVDGRVIERGHAAGLLDLHVERVAVAGDIEGDVDALSGRDAGIDLVLQPVLRDFLLDDLHVPAVAGAEIAAASADTEAALRATSGEGPVRTTDRTAFAEGNLVGLWFGSGLLFFAGRGRLFWLDFGILTLDLDGVGFFFLNLLIRLGDAFGVVGKNILWRGGRDGQRNGADQADADGGAPAAGAPAFAARSGEKGGVEHDQAGEREVKAGGPGEGARPTIVFEKNLSVLRHWLRWAE